MVGTPAEPSVNWTVPLSSGLPSPQLMVAVYCSPVAKPGSVKAATSAVNGTFGGSYSTWCGMPEGPGTPVGLTLMVGLTLATVAVEVFAPLPLSLSVTVSAMVYVPVSP